MKGKIFCLGRPILDVSAEIQREEWEILKKTVTISQENIPNLLTKLQKSANVFFISEGGVEFNVAINSALLGIPTIFVGAIGKDNLFSTLEKYTKKIPKLKLRLKVVANVPSAIILIIWVKGNKEEKIKLVDYGASNFLENSKGLENELKSSTIFLSSLYSANTPEMECVWKKCIEMSQKYQKEIVVNLGGIDTLSSLKMKEIIKIIKAANIVSMNNHELLTLKKEFEIEKDSLSALFPKATIIVTEGEKGAIIYSGENNLLIESILSNSDFRFTIGTGDAYLAGFLYAFKIKGCDLAKAGQFAAKLASLKIGYLCSHLTEDMIKIVKKEGELCTL